MDDKIPGIVTLNTKRRPSQIEHIKINTVPATNRSSSDKCPTVIRLRR